MFEGEEDTPTWSSPPGSQKFEVIADDGCHRDRSNTVKAWDIAGLTGGGANDCLLHLVEWVAGTRLQTVTRFGYAAVIVSLTAEHDRKANVPVICTPNSLPNRALNSQVHHLRSRREGPARAR